MAPESPRNIPTTTTTPHSHYTMKTTTRPQMSSSHSSHSHHPRHSQSNSQSLRSSHKSTTPIVSPRMPHSVGQPFPPAMMSPAVAQDVRTPSPNYFGLAVEPSEDRESARAPHDNWSPPTSSVRSFAAAIPKQLPLDANPEFEAFRKAADASRGKGFALGSSHFAMEPPSSLRPVPPRRPTAEIGNPFEMSLPRPPFNKIGSSRMDIDTDSVNDSAYVSSDSKSNSEGSMNAPPSFFDVPKFESPAQSESPFQPTRRSNLSRVEDAHPRLSLPQNKVDRLTPSSATARSETLPSNLAEGGPSLMMPAQLEEIIRNKPLNEYLLLDVRVSTHYAQARIKEALNLCIPTTLLKRATFDLQKLQKTLQTEEDQERFAQWRDVKDLIVYDGSSAEKRDAHSAMNMFKKFSNEGYSGNSHLLRGGFEAFASSYPSLIDRRSPAERAGATTNSNDGRPTFAPVIGGVMLPTGSDNPNPFFGNIRQNMDLADGVGQMDIAVPPGLNSSALPKWLETTTAKVDRGKAASDKFLNIERNEQNRMKDAYTAFNSTTAQRPNGNRVALSGIEKGGKNRYKDILPFEHTRVHLKNKTDDTNGDYINANHIQASRSNKRYIASQGPLPTTYDDFWSVIWDQDVRVIVMLTAETEGGTLKCHPYWKGHDFGSIKLKPLSEKKVSLDIDKHRSSSNATPASASSPEHGRRRANTTTTLDAASTPQTSQSAAETPYVIIRKFALSHASHPFAPIREITHLHYPSWPDFGAPAQPSHLLALVELANVMQRTSLPIDANTIALSNLSDKAAQVNWYDEPEHHAQARPMVVHCSAGCGRTGTFCTVDSVIDMLKRQRLAFLTARQKHDADADVDMIDPTSPLTTGANLGAGRQDPVKGSLEGVFKPILDRSISESSIDVVDWMKDDSLDLIEHTVEDFRGQRLSMVQSLRQFVLCYETVLEWIQRLQERSNPAMTTRVRTRSGSLKAMKK